MKKILVIGGSGFVGTHLIDLLKDNSHFEIKIFDKIISPKYPELTIQGNIMDKEKLNKVVSGSDLVINLAAEHRDDVTPTSLYYDVNVTGTKNILDVMDESGVKNFIFTSTVAVYGLNKNNPTEDHPIDPFNHYGKSKYQAELVIQKWFKEDNSKSVIILRPTVIFGENNRGNVYNLLNQIVSGKFLRIGSGNNKKSMSYVGNVVAFIKNRIENIVPGYEIYIYSDKPDFTTNELLENIEQSLNKKLPTIKIPYFAGIIGGYIFDILAFIIRKKLPVSSVRVKKFCATTQFTSININKTNFKAPYSLKDGLNRTIKHEFIP